MKRIIHIVLLMSAALPLTGCTSMQNVDMCLRNKCLTQLAWKHWCWCYTDVDHVLHFAKGFKAGYRDVLEGGKGCQPTMPPKFYWKSCYQSAKGKCKVNAWFDGFSHGALAAHQDGVASLSAIPISPTARLNLQMASGQPQPLGGYGHQMPPPAAHTPGTTLLGPLLPAGIPEDDDPIIDEAIPVRPYEDE